ncbi:MAG: hypothetical protein [Caudoviricetes sp.]|nr:MAG: hypothetical protein [Caudoviricetes sp.]
MKIFYDINFEDNDLRRAAGLQTKAPNFPPYNIVKLDENRAAIELAVAGFSISDIDIEQEKDVINITGKKEKSDGIPDKTYIHKGIAERNFNTSFKIAENVTVGSASLENGILSIELNIEKPEKKTIKIDVKS